MQIKLNGLIFLICLSILTFDLTAQDNNNWQKELASLKTNTVGSNILIIGDDRSGSTKNQRQLSADEYGNIIENYVNKYSGVIAARVIGNPVSQNLEFFRFKPTPKFIIPDLNEFAKRHKLTLTNRAKAKLIIDSLQRINDKISSENKKKINQYLKTINDAIINYKPNGKDLTNINDFLTHLDQLINEPQYKGKKIDVLILSDGVHDSDKKQVSPITFATPVRLYLIGWKNKANFQGTKVTINYFESKEGLLESISEIF